MKKASLWKLTRDPAIVFSPETQGFFFLPVFISSCEQQFFVQIVEKTAVRQSSEVRLYRPPFSLSTVHKFFFYFPGEYGILCGREGVSRVPKQQGIKKIADNRKAFHDYFVLERFEAGIELFGTEVKSIRAGQVNLKDSFCTIKDGELFVRGMHVSPYEHGNIFNKDPVRPRRLLMHKREILRLNGRVMQDGVALIPLSLYFKDSRVKVELGLCKGKKLYDKRQSDADRQSKRDIDRIMKERKSE